MNSSEKITGRILAVAQSEADGILLAAQKEADAINEEYKKKAAEIAANADSDAEVDAESIRSRTVASAEKIKRNSLLEAKNAKINEAFEKARLKLIGLPDSDYEKMLSIMLVSTVKNQLASEKISLEQDTDGEISACEQYVVILSETDKKRVSANMIKDASVLTSAEGKNLSVSDESASIDGGFILRCGEIEINCSIGLILSQLRDSLESDVYRILFG
ncbi:MAG: hypothetical protein E7633_09760 [Ruminococcaceae bacterium]|nr:hypothetical protein [Oscillospiraceae bacterium]